MKKRIKKLRKMSFKGADSTRKETKKILFVCVENAGRSQMAQGFAEALAKGRLEVYSAGSRPSSHINPPAIEVMKEKGIDLSGRRPKGLNDLPPVEMDYLITMGCEETCPAVPARKIIEWEIPDPKGKPIDESGGSEICWRPKGRSSLNVSPLERSSPDLHVNYKPFT